jgi:hypothetical protein
LIATKVLKHFCQSAAKVLKLLEIGLPKSGKNFKAILVEL